MEAATIIPLPGQSAAPPVDPFASITGGALAVSADKAALLLDCSISQIYKLVRTRQLAAVKLGTGKRAGLRINVETLRAFVDCGGATDELTPTPQARLARARGGQAWG